MIKTGSDFSGVGAFDQALRKLGINYQTVYACDWDKYSRQTYIENYGEPKYFPKDVYGREIPKESLDLYMTSPPCQAFSLAGKRKGEDDERGVLFYNSHEFIQKNNPRYFIFENVRGLLSDANGVTFKVWLDLLGGKSVNGNPVLFPNENSTPYHIYWKVLNAKHYGVPQNRERVFIIGIRDDADNTFRFPKTQHLNKKLKDVLEDSVDDKYFLSEKMVNRCTTYEWAKPFTDPDKKEIANCVTASYSKQASDCEYLKAPSAVIVHNIPQIVSVRKHKVEVKKLQELLKKHKTISNQKISKKLNIKKTTVDHWFRTDDGFSIPEANIWQDLKSLLKIKTNKFDKSITEFETREGVYEKANRVYDTKGIAPTMTSTSADEKILLNDDIWIADYRNDEGLRIRKDNISPCMTARRHSEKDISTMPALVGYKNRIRRLTPRECFRLMDFPEDFKWSVSDTQAYKQAGNSIVVNVLAEIINKLKL